jgi:hypothetical protein
MKKQLFVLISLMLSTLPLSVSAHGKHMGYDIVDVKNGGTITGKVTFTGNDPAPQVFPVTKDTEVCGKSREIDFVKVHKEGGLTDVVVYLENVKKGKPFTNTQQKVTVEQKACGYGPLLSVMIEGNKLEIVNTDDVAHKMHAYEMRDMGAKKTMFSISQPPEKNRVVTKEVDIKKGEGMMMQCDQHEFMKGFMFVAKNPYYTLVAEDGSFTIDNISPGYYTVKAWHGTLKRHPQQPKFVGMNQTVTVNLEYKK